MLRILCLVAAAIYLALLAAPTWSSDLSYSYVDLGAVLISPDATGVQSPVPGQDVRVDLSDGDGLIVGGSLAISRQFYVTGSFASAIVDVDATVTSPITTTTVTDNFDLIQTRLAFGYLHEIAENLDVVAELSYDSVEYDFGSFAGENFDADDSGAGGALGIRWNPRPEFELYASGRASSVGTVDLTTGAFDSDVSLVTGVRWYVFEDLGLGLDFRSGDRQMFAFSMRFGFGDLRFGGN